MQMPAGFSDLLGRRFDGVARVVLRHERRRKFRWMAIPELLLAGLLFVCLIPVLILFMVLGGDGDDFDFPTFRLRFFHHWHELVLTILGPQGQPLAEIRHAPVSGGEGEGIVAAVLAAAQREGVVVVETLGDASTAEIAEVWYGGRPLLAPPGLRPEAQSAAMLAQAGLLVEQTPGQASITEELPAPGRILSIVVLVALGLPLLPLLLVASGRRLLWGLWQGAQGKGPPRRVITLRAESVSVHTERGSNTWGRHVLDGADLLGITFSPALGYDRDVTRRDATLRLVGGRGTVTVPMTRALSCGPALRDFMIASTLRLRAERPELGLLGPGPRPTKCPYCAGLYDMQPGGSCPFCGAPAGAVR